MVNHTGWYPPGQVCYPPQLPTYLRNVYDLEPIIGVPSDTEVIGIHAVIQAASKVSGVPGMYDPTLFMGLADHLFGAQMARYRSRYSLVVFPSDATYTPPTTTLPAHISVNLEPVYGAPSDEEIVKAQEAVRSYQQFSHVPALFDGKVNMELSQHLFDLQMARYMRCAGESQPSPVPQVVAKPESPIRTVNQPSGTSDESTGVTNNAGTGASAATMQAPQFPSSVDVREVMERSNQLTERLATLLERSNELAERPTQSTEDIGSLAERFNQVLERLTQLVENTRQTTAPDPLTERFNQLFERFDRAVEYSDRSAQQANQLAERSNQLIERSNQLAEQLNQPSHLPNHLTARSNQILEQSNQLAERLNQVLGGLHPVRRANELSERANQLSEHLYQSFQRSNQLAEQANGHAERLGNVMKNINKVLVGIQHAIIRNRKDNGWGAIFSLVNEAGEALGVSRTTEGISVGQAFKPTRSMDTTLIRVVLGASTIEYHVVTSLLGECLYFFGLSDGFCVDRTNTTLIQGRETDAGLRLADYLSSCFL